MKKFEVIVASPVWSLNGVNIFSSNLVRELCKRGVPAHILLTQPHIPDSKPMQRPTDVPIHHFPVGEEDLFGVRWKKMIRYLEDRAPCIYIPNYDFEHSCVSPKLSNRVGVVGVVHSDDPQHYEHVGRLGKYWNNIACVSQTVAESTIKQNPNLADRVFTIPIGVSIPNTPPERAWNEGKPLKVLYAGVFRQSQKRILDLPQIIQRCLELHAPIHLTIAGGGPDQQELMDACQPLVEQGFIQFIGIVPHVQMPDLFRQHDVFIMTSAFEGMPNALIEAMGQGCIPIATNIKSGIPELVKDGINGYLVSVGDISTFAEQLAGLQKDINLQETLSNQAFQTVDQGHYRIRDMTDSYLELFERVMQEAELEIYQRPPADILLPDYMKPLWKHYLPLPVFKFGQRWKRTLFI